ncbi:MAG TPA: helix-turn-helix domain-containing protein [Sedimentisphaerales bacterium]|jgi:excisionase family DNA binding protein|nr:helix-turn-helix domain-containing protein [Sedimentisphaerales bacterium]
MLSFFIVVWRGREHEQRIPMDRTKWLTIEELAEYLKMGRTKLYSMARDGDIPASKVGNQWRFDREEIDQWMKSQRPAADKEQTGGTE